MNVKEIEELMLDFEKDHNQSDESLRLRLLLDFDNDIAGYTGKDMNITKIITVKKKKPISIVKKGDAKIKRLF